VIKAFKGKKIHLDIEIYGGPLSMPVENENYTYRIITGPTELIVDGKKGIVWYNVLSDAKTEVIPISIMVTNKNTGDETIVSAVMVVMDTEIVASGTIGQEGGQIYNDWQDVVLTVLPDTVTKPTKFEVLRAINEEILELFPGENKPNILEEESVISKIKYYIFDFVDKFEWSY